MGISRGKKSSLVNKFQQHQSRVHVSGPDAGLPGCQGRSDGQELRELAAVGRKRDSPDPEDHPEVSGLLVGQARWRLEENGCEWARFESWNEASR